MFLLCLFALGTAAQDTPAKLISAPRFEISAEDEAAGIEGTLKIAVDIDEKGDVKKASLYVGPSWPCSGKADHRIMPVIEQAENAARKWKFAPATKDGKPVPTRIGLSVRIDNGSLRNAAGAAGTVAPKTVVGGVVNGKALRLERPMYPAEARQVRAAGAVSVQVLIDEEGNVTRAQAIDGSPYLMFAARSAACQSKFSPTLLEGQPVKVSGVITYNFVP